MNDSPVVNNKPCSQAHYEVTAADLPLSCPTKDMRLWDGHPRVYLPIAKTGTAVCPYCGATYTLVDNKGAISQHD